VTVIFLHTVFAELIACDNGIQGYRAWTSLSDEVSSENVLYALMTTLAHYVLILFDHKVSITLTSAVTSISLLNRPSYIERIFVEGSQDVCRISQ
jgi:hypothetical protein